MVKEIKCEIPQTTEENYITGFYALNITAEDGNRADWHDVWSWGEGVEKPRTVSVAGITFPSTNHILGNYGVIECREHLKSIGFAVSHTEKVYRANYFRAMLDDVYKGLIEYGVKHKKIIGKTGYMYDFLDNDDQKTEFYTICKIMLQALDEEQKPIFKDWVVKEYEYDTSYGDSELDIEIIKDFR